jgi:hypothetical protein
MEWWAANAPDSTLRRPLPFNPSVRHLRIFVVLFAARENYPDLCCERETCRPFECMSAFDPFAIFVKFSR